MLKNRKEYSLSQLAKKLNVHRDTILYWEEKGLIDKPRRNPHNNYRVFNEEEVNEIARKRGLI